MSDDKTQQVSNSSGNSIRMTTTKTGPIIGLLIIDADREMES